MPCPYCRHDQIIYVHGHGQCAKCGTNIEPCCDGGGCELKTEAALATDQWEINRHNATPASTTKP
ncbi:MAG: hypothetical protein ABL309_12970 [Phycisphaerales bacterium]